MSKTAEYIAAVTVIYRQLRIEHPIGEFDSAGRWYPDIELERQDCCDLTQYPSRRWPNSLNNHCRTIKHVATLYDVPFDNIVKLCRKLTSEIVLLAQTNDKETTIVKLIQKYEK